MQAAPAVAGDTSAQQSLSMRADRMSSLILLKQALLHVVPRALLLAWGGSPAVC
jgi:hypothetical protein